MREEGNYWRIERDIQPERATVRLYDVEKGLKEYSRVVLGGNSTSYSRSYLSVGVQDITYHRIDVEMDIVSLETFMLTTC